MKHHEYQYGSLDEKDLRPDAIEQFKKWFEEYTKDGKYPTLNGAMFSTSSKSGRTTSRIVLVKGIDERGFLFFTSYASAKAKQIEENPSCCLAFYWPEFERQVLVHGKAIKVGKEESIKYYESRSFEAQAASACSDQSVPIESREALEKKHRDLMAKHQADKQIPYPEDWGGYRVVPENIEFWQGRESRLNDRLVYEKNKDGSWTIKRLQP